MWGVDRIAQSENSTRERIPLRELNKRTGGDGIPPTKVCDQGIESSGDEQSALERVQYQERPSAEQYVSICALDEIWTFPCLRKSN